MRELSLSKMCVCVNQFEPIDITTKQFNLLLLVDNMQKHKCLFSFATVCSPHPLWPEIKHALSQLEMTESFIVQPDFPHLYTMTIFLKTYYHMTNL